MRLSSVLPSCTCLNVSPALVWLDLGVRQGLHSSLSKGSREWINSQNQKCSHNANDIKLSFRVCWTFKYNYLCLLPDWEAEVPQNLHQGQFNNQQGKSHPQTVPWANPKWQVSVWIDALLVLLAKSWRTTIQWHIKCHLTICCIKK